MRVIITPSAELLAQEASRIVAKQLQRKPASVLGLATGTTPITLYQQLVRLYQQGILSFKQVISFNLDEYYLLAGSHPQSYRYFMDQHLFNAVDINPTNTHVPACLAGEDPQQCAVGYELAIQAAGGIDLQILGIGANGHIGFNEPGSSLASRTRLKTLTAKTLTDNSRLFQADEYQPDLAMTMGVGTILEAKQIVILASGAQKATAVQQMILGPMSANCPASALQMHPNVIAIIDEQAAAKLDHADYFRLAETNALSLLQS